MHIASRLIPLTICVAIAMHLIWSVSLGVDPSGMGVTAISMLQAVPGVNYVIAALIFGTVAFLATIGLIMREPALRVMFILPQQVTLWFSFVGVAHAVWVGHFASGYVASPLYLLMDQVPVVLIAIGHTAALLLIAGARRESA